MNLMTDLAGNYGHSLNLKVHPVIFNALNVPWKSKNKQLICAIFAGKQLFVVGFPLRLENIKKSQCEVSKAFLEDNIP